MTDQEMQLARYEAMLARTAEAVQALPEPWQEFVAKYRRAVELCGRADGCGPALFAEFVADVTARLAAPPTAAEEVAEKVAGCPQTGRGV